MAKKGQILRSLCKKGTSLKKTHYRCWDEKEIWKIPREKNTTDRSDRTERIDKTDRKYRKDRTEMTDRTDRADRTDTTGRTDRQNIIDINLTCQDTCVGQLSQLGLTIMPSKEREYPWQTLPLSCRLSSPLLAFLLLLVHIRPE